MWSVFKKHLVNLLYLENGRDLSLAKINNAIETYQLAKAEYLSSPEYREGGNWFFTNGYASSKGLFEALEAIVSERALMNNLISTRNQYISTDKFEKLEADKAGLEKRAQTAEAKIEIEMSKHERSVNKCIVRQLDQGFLPEKFDVNVAPDSLFEQKIADTVDEVLNIFSDDDPQQIKAKILSILQEASAFVAIKRYADRYANKLQSQTSVTSSLQRNGIFPSLPAQSGPVSSQHVVTPA